MKKVLSLVLAFAMILGSFGFVFASQFPDVEDTEYYSEAVNVLSGFGVIGGFPDGTFGPDKEVTRAQMATMIVNALGMTVSGQSDTKYSDVPKSHWASGFIAYATSVGFVAGYPDGTFKPDDQVTYDQALTMIVAALGYKAESLPGNWPGNFVNKAQGLGILDTCKTTGTKNAPRQDIACFLYDALGCAIGYTDKDGTWHFNDANGDNRADDDMYTRLGAVAYKGGARFVVDGSDEAVIDMDKYFGAYVTAYASKDDPNTIVAIKEVLSEFIEGKVNTAKDTVKGEESYKITSSSAQAPGFIYFLNGDDTTSTSPTQFKDTTGVMLKFAVKLAGNKIDEVYSVQEWKATGTFRADDTIQEELADDQTLNGGGYNFVIEDDEIVESEFIMVGKAKLADLAEDDIITVYLDKNTKIAKLEVSTEKVEGTISKINKAGDVYTIGSTDYDVASDALAAAKNLQPDTEGTFFLNYAGEVFAFDVTKNTTKNYGVVLACGMDAARYAGGETPYVKMFLADGTTGEFAVDPDEYAGAKISGTAWTTPIAAGTVVEYEIDSDNVVVGFTPMTKTYVSAKTDVDANGVVGGKAIKSDTVIFSYSGTDKTVAKNYSVKTLEDIKSASVTSIIGDEDNGDLLAILVEGLEESSKVFAIFASEDGKNADGKLWTALYDGDVKSMTMKTTLAPSTYTTAAGATLYTLTFDGETVKGVTTAAAGTDYNVGFDAAPGAKLEVSGNTFKLSGTNYSLASDAVVYIYDESDKEWTKGKLSNVKYNWLVLIGTGSGTDKEYDIVLVTKD